MLTFGAALGAIRLRFCRRIAFQLVGEKFPVVRDRGQPNFAFIPLTPSLFRLSSLSVPSAQYILLLAKAIWGSLCAPLPISSSSPVPCSPPRMPWRGKFRSTVLVRQEASSRKSLTR